ncbi:MAG: ABC transporter permease [Clostridiales bacterium]|nr:ABC transporter permease [Clostridiales bacterium]
MLNYLMTLEGAAIQGMLWGIMAIGVYITYRVLNIADMSVEGPFALGGALPASWITRGADPFLVLLLSMAGGMLAGLVTGILHTVFQIPAILSGILTMIALYSINLRVMGKSMISLIQFDTFISRVSPWIQDLLPFLPDNQITYVTVAVIGLAVIALIVFSLYLFFGTEIGCAIRATCNNENMVRALGTNTNSMKLLGLVLSNGLVGLSGGLIAQYQGYADVQMGVGSIVIGLASVIIGEVLFCHRDHSFAYKLVAVLLGSIIYRLVIATVMSMGMDSSDLKLFTAILVAVALGLPVLMNYVRERRKQMQNKRRQAALAPESGAGTGGDGHA